MKISAQDLSEIIVLLKNSNEYKPIIKQAINVFVDFAKEFKEPVETFNNWIIDSRIETIKKYIKAGFGKKDAILMTLNDTTQLKKYIENRFNGKK